MLGWTLGGHPSPNLEAAVAGLEGRELEEVARRRHGARHADCALEAWRGYSRAFREFPFHVGCVYHAPWQMGPANLLWSEPTGYASTMVGLPVRRCHTLAIHLSGRSVVRPTRKGGGWIRRHHSPLRTAAGDDPPESLREELRFAEACAIQLAQRRQPGTMDRGARRVGAGPGGCGTVTR